MDIYKIVAIGIISAILIVYLKSINSELSLIATICSGILILTLSASYIKDFLSLIMDISGKSNNFSEYIKIIIKIIAISYLVEFTAQTIEDFGLKGLSDKVVFGGKLIVISLSVPIIRNLIEQVIEFL